MKNSLRYYRKKAKLSQEELGQATGFGTSTIGNAETGRTEASAEFWDAMSKALKVPVEDLTLEFPEWSPEHIKVKEILKEEPGGSEMIRLSREAHAALHLAELVATITKLRTEARALHEVAERLEKEADELEKKAGIKRHQTKGPES